MRLAALALTALLAACAPTTHSTVPSSMGVARPSAELLALLDEPGPIEVETVTSVDWQVTLSGLLNLEHPTAKAAGLTDRDEPIQVFFHALRHPGRGTYLVDSGMENALRDDPSKAAIRGLVASEMKTETLVFHHPLGVWLSQEEKPVAGVLFTHLHLDHVSGLPDVPKGTPLYAGPGETGPRAFMNVFTQGTIDRALEGHDAVQEWPFAAEADAPFEAVVDVFGDGSLWALSVPGHTPGSTAYLARTPNGPVLLTGDASHTAWGWEHDVEPGTFTADGPKSVESFTRLKAFVAAHPNVEVRLGHQHLHRE